MAKTKTVPKKTLARHSRQITPDPHGTAHDHRKRSTDCGVTGCAKFRKRNGRGDAETLACARKLRAKV